MDVSIPQGDTPPQSDGNMAPIDLTQSRIFMRLEGTQSATVSGGGGGLLVWMLYIWGEPERAPHLREVRHRCLYVYIYIYIYIYIYVPYVMPYSSIYAFTMAAASEPL